LTLFSGPSQTELRSTEVFIPAGVDLNKRKNFFFSFVFKPKPHGVWRSDHKRALASLSLIGEKARHGAEPYLESAELAQKVLCTTIKTHGPFFQKVIARHHLQGRLRPFGPLLAVRRAPLPPLPRSRAPLKGATHPTASSPARSPALPYAPLCLTAGVCL
jgi:hypothetical protein